MPCSAKALLWMLLRGDILTTAPSPPRQDGHAGGVNNSHNIKQTYGLKLNYSFALEKNNSFVLF